MEILVVLVIAWVLLMAAKSKPKARSSKARPAKAAQPVKSTPAGRAAAQSGPKTKWEETDPRWKAPDAPENGLYPADYLAKLRVQKEERNAQDSHYKFVVINLETTGLDGNEDDILQVSIVDNEGNTLIDQRCKPGKVKKWEDAAEVNEIYFADVAYCPTFEQIAEYVQDILSRSAKIMAYQRQYKQWFLDTHGVDHKKFKWSKDIARSALHYYNVQKGRNRQKWLSLDDVAEMTGFTGETDTCLERAEAARYIYIFLEDWEKRLKEWTKRQREEEAAALKNVSTVDTKTPPPGDSGGDV